MALINYNFHHELEIADRVQVCDSVYFTYNRIGTVIRIFDSGMIMVILDDIPGLLADHFKCSTYFSTELRPALEGHHD